jgi:hypothetical protein
MKKPAVIAGALITVVAGLGLVLAVAVGTASIGNLGSQPPTLKATATGANTASIALSTLPDSQPCHQDASGNSSWVTYCPSTALQVPANSVITFTIDQYDTGGTLPNPFFARVMGTVGGTMTVDGRTVSSVDPGGVAHTFTITSQPGQTSPLDVNVPLPAVADDAPNTVTVGSEMYPKPIVVTFQLRTGAPGLYFWHCYFPCGTGLAGSNAGFGGPMAATGYMSGTLNVT